MPREKNPIPVTIRKRAPRKPVVAVATEVTLTTRFVGPEQRAALIAEAAFFRAEKRGFAPDHEVTDWLAAESEVDAKLMRLAADGPKV
jgi:hypothetical protein